MRGRKIEKREWGEGRGGVGGSGDGRHGRERMGEVVAVAVVVCQDSV